ncbi:SDR family NAD(P)-dependent oxidoreductase [Actinomycetaceae bacterium WB03_NA08]|uniref:SDR family NAD(P)-dependent oxidoreductase n=2 Tax=Scrofimicrobium canadense TaxID=2652290 RepID=A0A6N7VRD2_9ACTO|nr:SDR family NAD(P)-dependent oxidoreductase [Scrofimicrobium canadense]MSS84317.1 SDR family NAD(P)-dependent oxidoreductase [Scrofimicrobium canadense]
MSASKKAAEVVEQYMVRVHVIVADLQNPSSARKIHEEIDSWGFTVDTLINNAGFSSFGDFADSGMGWEMGQIDVNVWALVALTKGFLPELLIAFNMCSCSVFDASGYLLWQLNDSSL